MPYRRSTRLIASLPYWGYVLVGAIAFASPGHAVEERVRAGAYVWAGMFLLGGAVSGVAALLRRWVTERWGAGLIIAANAVYAVSLAARWALSADHNLTALLLAVIFLILIAELFVRQRELTILARGSAHRTKGRP